MDDLKAISSFKPSSEVSTCVVLEKKKTYLYDRWGRLMRTVRGQMKN